MPADALTQVNTVLSHLLPLHYFCALRNMHNRRNLRLKTRILPVRKLTEFVFDFAQMVLADTR